METNEPPASPPARKPWPMKWIVLVIGLYIAGYTFINIAYRKPPGSAHEPAAEARTRTLHTVQTTLNGWVRISARYEPSSGSPTAPATIAEKPLPDPLDRALPPDLPPIVPGLPALHPATLSLKAPAQLTAGEALNINLDFPSGASVPGFGEILAYAKDNHLYVFIQDSRHLAPGAAPTPATSPLALVLPPGFLAAGAWKASAFSATSAFEWTFSVE